LKYFFNPFDVYVEYTRHEKVAFFLFNVEYTRRILNIDTITLIFDILH